MPGVTAALMIFALGAQAPASLFAEFEAAHSARRMEILRQLSREQTSGEIGALIRLVKAGLRDSEPDVREAVLGVAMMRTWLSLEAGTTGRPMRPHPMPGPDRPPIPAEWKGDEHRLRAELWDDVMSILKNDADDRVRHQALLAIGNIQMATLRGEPIGPLLPLFVDLYRHDRSDRIRAEVVKTFRLDRKAPTPTEMRAVLRDALVDTSQSVRHEAQGAIIAQSLGVPVKLSFDEARDTLVNALKNSDPRVRLGAVQALNIFGAASAPYLATLERMSKSDPDAQVRTSSQLAIEAIHRALRGK